jgi:hypothetical protein
MTLRQCTSELLAGILSILDSNTDKNNTDKNIIQIKNLLAKAASSFHEAAIEKGKEFAGRAAGKAGRPAVGLTLSAPNL